MRFLQTIIWIFGCIIISESVTAQAVCSGQRYVNNIFTVQTTQEPAIYGTAEAVFFPPFISESLTDPQDLSFDFYEPAGDTLTKRPLIIMAFGGAYLGGSKRQSQLVDFCESMAKKGFCVASIDYRIGFNVFSTNSATRAVYRALQDYKAAIRYFRANASTYKIDPNNVFAGGNSAGSINGVHAAYGDYDDYLNDPLLAPVHNSPALGCPDCSGNTIVENSVPDAVVNLWGAIGDTLWIDSGEAPIISFHGTADITVSAYTDNPFNYPVFPELDGSVPISERATNLGITNEVHIFPGEGHELWNNSANALFIENETADFFYQFMKPNPPSFSGDNFVCINSVKTYQINNPTSGSDYCWTVSNGTIINYNNHSVDILWSSSGNGTIEVREENCLDVLGDPTSFAVTIDPTPAPISDFTFSYTGSATNFSDNSLGATSYLWDFGDGGSSTLQNPVHLFTNNGNYLVSLTVTNAVGCTDTYSTLVHQNCQPNQTFSGGNTANGIFQTMNWIYSDEPLSPGAITVFKAGNYIELNTGFESGSNNVFCAEIEVCQN